MNNKSSRIQPVKFRTIDEFLDFIPANELEIVQVLRNIILQNIPACTEKLAYNVPFFYRHSRICFVWPGSITWGNVKPDTVRLGFVHGSLMRDEINYLDKGDRKKVCFRDYTNIREIDPDVLKLYIFEAGEIDEQLFNKKKKSGKL